MKRLASALAVLALSVCAGCVTLPGMSAEGGSSGSSTTARAPVSQDTDLSEARKRAKVHAELGSLYLRDGRFAIALEEAHAALKFDPDYAPAYNLLGLTHMFMGENPRAEESFERALRLAPGDPEIENNFGWYLCQTAREKRSLDYFLRSAKNPLYPTPAKSYTSAGLCSMRLKDDKSAEQYLMRALQHDPNNSQALYGLAELAYRSTRFLEARQWLLDLEKNIDLNAEATWLALRVEHKLGNREGEARHTAQLRRKFPGSAELRRLQQGSYE